MTEPERVQPEPGPDAGLEEIQTDIDQTRQQLGETVQALSAKLDVKAHARQKVDDTKARVVDTAQSARQKAGQAGPAVPALAFLAIAAVVGTIIWRRRR
jgi:hypothetical protein